MTCKQVRATWLGVMAALAVGCGDTPPALDATFAGPSGLAVAGSDFGLLFVANAKEDALQVLDLGTGLSSIDTVAAPAHLFALRVPVGSNPTALAATADGRYVVVLQAGTGTLGVVDADAQVVVRAAGGGPLDLRLAAGSNAVHSVVRSPAPCAEPCVGRFMASLPVEGVVAAVELHADASGVRWVVGDAHVLPGQPAHLAAHPSGDLLFASDAASAGVWRLHVPSGVADRIEVGAPPGTLAVSTDGSALVVARPLLRDVVVLGDIAAAQPMAVAVNGTYAPRVECLADCTATESPCLGAHPADAELCRNDAGLALSAIAPAYEALYVGEVVTQLLPLGVGAGYAALSWACGGAELGAAEYVLAAGLSGELRYITLRQDSTSALAPELLRYNSCLPLALNALPGTDDAPAVAPSEILAPCMELPAGRARAACASDAAGAGVVVFPSQGGDGPWTFEWEAVVFSRLTGGGEIDPDGGFSDVGGEIPSDVIQPRQVDADTGELTHAGDILVPVPQVGQACLDLTGGEEPPACSFERRIVAIEGGRMILDTALPPQCFPGGGTIRYEVRAGDAFVLGGLGQGFRAKPGQRFGLGSQTAPQAPVAFDLLPLSGGSELGACERYEADGTPKAPVSSVLRRGRVIGFEVDDPSLVARTGVELDAAGGVLGPAGRIPAALVAAPAGFAAGAAFVAYAGSDTLLALVPHDAGDRPAKDSTTRAGFPDAMFVRDSFRILR